MKLTYIDHSCFCIEESDVAVLIDYFRDTPGGYVRNRFLAHPGPLYVLASHAHADHFNLEVLSWREQRPDIRYLFSSDIRKKREARLPDIVFLRKGEIWHDERLTVKGFGSTDAGISFLLETGGWRIFHAGDLNNWHWKSESSPEEVRNAETRFLQELAVIRKEAVPVDLALFPVDPRMGEAYDRGARQFVDAIHPSLFAPMHSWGDYRRANRFEACAEEHGVRFLGWTRPGETVELTRGPENTISFKIQ